ncbi:MAG: energy-coupling factor transporter transmembrane component T [Coprococcus phoceensis]
MASPQIFEDLSSVFSILLQKKSEHTFLYYPLFQDYLNLLTLIILRFLPSLKQDVLYIKQGMKTRGVGLSFWRIISHPAQTYEGFLIPILMRLLMTATELSASAETRGISYPCEKTHYILVDFRLRDSILLIGMLALFAVVIWTSFQSISLF